MTWSGDGYVSRHDGFCWRHARARRLDLEPDPATIDRVLRERRVVREVREAELPAICPCVAEFRRCSIHAHG